MSSGRSSRTQGGFTFLAMLVAVAVIGVGLAATGEVWVQSRQREKEQELLFVGNQYRRAIGLYYEGTENKTTCPAKCYPEKLADLLEDKRYAAKKRYLRKLYPDPMTGKAEWGLIAPAGGIMGVYSLSGATPIKTSGFLERDRTFEGANHFSDWKFLHEVKLPAQAAGKPPAAPGTQTPLAAPTATPLQPPVPPTGTSAPH